MILRILNSTYSSVETFLRKIQFPLSKMLGVFDFAEISKDFFRFSKKLLNDFC